MQTERQHLPVRQLLHTAEDSEMKRVIVIGCPGSGKSTFSRKLHEITGIPLYHLDMMFWNADRTTVGKAVFLDRLQDALKKEEWIIDGNYASTMELRVKVCDTVIFLDYPMEVCLQGIRDRKGKARSDMPWTEPEEDDEEFIEFIRNYNADSRPQVMELLNRYREKEIYIFTDRSQAEAYLRILHESFTC